MARLKLKSLKQFRFDHRRLRKLYRVTALAYDFAAAELQNRLDGGAIQADTPIFSDGERIARSPHELVRRLPKAYSAALREALLVRLVSILEVFLVDAIQEVFYRSREAFKFGREIRFSQEQLLSFSSLEELHAFLIESECRRLTGRGFNMIRDFYKKRLEIDIVPPYIPAKAVEEIHERRHLLVHAGGRVDEKYRRHAEDKEIGSRLTVSAQYLEEAFEITRKIGFRVAREIRRKWPTKSELRRLEA
jgi:hypothetical protein